MVVNVGVVNLHHSPSFKSEIVTQAILGECPEVLDQQDKWFLLRQWDGYEGWAYHFYLTKDEHFAHAEPRLRITSLWTSIYELPAPGTQSVRDAVFGTGLPFRDQQQNWYEVLLPDGISGWLRNDPPGYSGELRDRLVQVGRRFLGVPYMWGGKTPRGFDCSGFIQTVFKTFDVSLPRDAHLQYRFQDLDDVDILDALPGDLVFFSEDSQQISHVGMSLGRGDFIHASGWVKIESLMRGSRRYNHLLHGMLTAAKDVSPLFQTEALQEHDTV